ncbi:MAG: SMC-Scp complex subunit ScpB [bacterium]|nr:SMC-Scp complex subunit ScpB [bacterium]
MTERERLYDRIECMLFVAGDPVPVTEIARVLELPEKEARALLTEMERSYREAGRGLRPLITEGTAQLISNPDYVRDIEELLQPERTRSVSQSMLETLAIVAYRQPVTRADIEAVRGVRCEYAVTQLQKLGLIVQVGRRDTVGKPALFGTTDRFLRQFGLHSLEELPEFLRFSQAEQSAGESSGADAAPSDAQPLQTENS